MIFLIAEIGIGALLGGLTVIGIMVEFIMLCFVMRALVSVLEYDFEAARERSMPD